MKSIWLAGIATALLCATSVAVAGVNQWSALGPVGGQVNKIAFSATPKTVFLIAQGGFFRSQDGGVTWQLVSANFFNAPSGMALDPSDSSRIYVVAPNWPSVYVSSDGGATLAAAPNIPTSLTQAEQVVVSQDGMTLYVSSGAAIFSSTNRGQTWQQRTAIGADPLARVVRLIIDPTDSKTLYASAITSATGEAILASHDGAMTWQVSTSGSASQNFALDLSINPANPQQIWAARLDGLWVSNDRAASWQVSNATPVSAVVVDPQTPANVYAGTAYGHLLTTTNSGSSWSDVTGNLGSGEVYAVAVNPTQDTQILVGGIAGLAASSTSGTHWSMQQTGLISTSITGLSADSTTDRIYIDVGVSGVYYEASGSGITVPVNNAALTSLEQATTVDNITAILADSGRLFASLTTGLASSSDGGNTWALTQVVPSGPQSASQQIFDLASPVGQPQSLLAASMSALYGSTNGGTLWTQVGAGLPANSSVTRLLVAPSDATVTYAYINPVPTFPASSTPVGIYRSADGGNTWSSVSSDPTIEPSALLAVDPTAANSLYGSSASALLKSDDGGATWNQMTWNYAAAEGVPNSLAVDPVHPQILYAASVASIMRSVDGGTSWEVLRAAGVLPIWTAFSILADPKRPENLLVSTSGYGVQQLTVAPDLALTATVPPSPVAVGAASTYSYSVANLGPFDATDVTLRLQLPATAQGVEATVKGGTCVVAAAIATCAVPVLRSQSNVSVSLSAIAPAAGSFSVTGSVLGDQPDANPQNNSVVSAATIAVIADLSVTAAGSANAAVGDAVTYTLTVTNAGPNGAPAQVTYVLPSGVTPGSVTSSGASCSSNGSRVTCNLANVAQATPITITVNGTAASTGVQTSTATITTTATDPVSANNSASFSTTVAAAPPPATPPPVTPPPATSLPVAAPPPASGGGGGALSCWELVALGALAYATRCAGSARRERGVSQ